jgi:hypothetical protein
MDDFVHCLWEKKEVDESHVFYSHMFSIHVHSENSETKTLRDSHTNVSRNLKTC